MKLKSHGSTFTPNHADQQVIALPDVEYAQMALQNFVSQHWEDFLGYVVAHEGIPGANENSISSFSKARICALQSQYAHDHYDQWSEYMTEHNDNPDILQNLFPPDYGKPLVCDVCGGPLDDYSVILHGDILCRDCFEDYCDNPNTVAMYLPGFIEKHKSKFLYGWWDSVCLEWEREAILAKAYEEWKKDPSGYKRLAYAHEIEMDFRTSKPGEWEDYIKEMER